MTGAEILKHDSASVRVVFDCGEAARQRRRSEERRKLTIELYLRSSLTKRRERRFDNQAPGQVGRSVSGVRDRQKDQLGNRSLKFELKAYICDCAMRQRPGEA